MRRFMAAVLLAPFLVIILSAPAQAAPPGTGPATLTVTDTTTGAVVAAEHEPQTGAFRFDLVSGHNYVFSGGA